MTTNPTARLVVSPDFTIGPVDRRVFGSFVEHLGRCVYTGIYEPGHPTADEFGFRGDVAELVRELAPTIIRYPGGNFVSCYDWRDGIGPRDQRPVRYDLAWNVVETNEVGTDEGLQWCERMGLEPMMAVNLGTRGVPEAVELLQYCIAPTGLTVSDERATNGHPDPYPVTVWCLGNEMDGPWQMGHKTPEEYARLAAETARAMKRYDESIELVACGSSNRSMPTFGTWERIVLEECFDLVEHVSAHAYYEPVGGDEVSFLASAEDMDRFISGVVATADHVAAVRGSTKKIMISFDEWNVWFAERRSEHRDPDAVAEDVYDVQDAVVVGSLLIELLRHADRVAIACQAQLVNVLGPILTRPGGPAWRQTIFHPFALAARHSQPIALRGVEQSPVIGTDRFGEVRQLHSVVTVDEAATTMTVLAANRSRTDVLDLTVDLAGFGAGWSIVEHLALHDDDPYAVNTADQPDRVVPHAGDAALTDAGTVTCSLPPISWHCLRLTRTP